MAGTGARRILSFSILFPSRSSRSFSSFSFLALSAYTCLSLSDMARHLSATMRLISPNFWPGFSSIVILRTSALNRMYAVTSFFRCGFGRLFNPGVAGLKVPLTNKVY